MEAPTEQKVSLPDYHTSGRNPPSKSSRAKKRSINHTVLLRQRGDHFFTPKKENGCQGEKREKGSVLPLNRGVKGRKKGKKETFGTKGDSRTKQPLRGEKAPAFRDNIRRGEKGAFGTRREKERLGKKERRAY